MSLVIGFHEWWMLSASISFVVGIGFIRGYQILCSIGWIECFGDIKEKWNDIHLKLPILNKCVNIHNKTVIHQKIGKLKNYFKDKWFDYPTSKFNFK